MYFFNAVHCTYFPYFNGYFVGLFSIKFSQNTIFKSYCKKCTVYNKQKIQVFCFLSSRGIKIIIFHSWLPLLLKYLFSYHSMKINPLLIDKILMNYLQSFKNMSIQILVNKYETNERKV
jgi:hypothetical protein